MKRDPARHNASRARAYAGQTSNEKLQTDHDPAQTVYVCARTPSSLTFKSVPSFLARSGKPHPCGQLREYPCKTKSRRPLHASPRRARQPHFRCTVCAAFAEAARLYVFERDYFVERVSKAPMEAFSSLYPTPYFLAPSTDNGIRTTRVFPTHLSSTSCFLFSKAPILTPCSSYTCASRHSQTHRIQFFLRPYRRLLK